MTSIAVAGRNPHDSNAPPRSVGKLAPSTEDIRRLLTAAKTAGAYVVCWNTVFDVAWLIALGLREEVMALRWLDAMLLWRHLTIQPEYNTTGAKRKSYSLKSAMEEFFPDKSGFKDIDDFHTDTPEARARLLERNMGDAQYTLILAKKFLADLPQSARRSALIEACCIPLVAESMLEGLDVDVASTEALQKTLRDAARLAYVTLRLGNPEVTDEVLGSPRRLGALLFDQWGLPVPKLTDKGARSTDKDVLSALADADPRVKLIHTWRESSNLLAKYADGVLESVRYNGDGRVRPAPRIFGTYTGRFTYSSKQGRGAKELPVGIPIAQFKRGKDFRKSIIAPEGYTLMEFDFAGQEFRWMAVESNDETMLALCAPGEDAHGFMASRIAGRSYRDLVAAVKAEDPEASLLRKQGKVANLSLQYRTSWKTLQVRARTDYGVRLTDAEAQAIHATYRCTYLGVPEYWKRQIRRGRTRGYVETLGGRRVGLGAGNTWEKDLAWSYESTCINFPIQGVGADQKYLALMVLHDLLARYDGRFYFELHDGIYVLIPHRHAQRAYVEIRQALSDLPYKRAWGVDLPIDFPVDGKVGSSWGDLHEPQWAA